MKQLLLILSLSLTGFSFSQLTWKELSSTPSVPPAGSIAASSGDFLIAEDGRMYSAYLYNPSGTNLIMVDEYVVGTGWQNIYQDYVYGGFQTIHSFKLGSDIYFSVKRDDPAPQQMMRIYKVSSGSVSISATVPFSNIVSNAEYELVINQAGTAAYFLHKDMSDVGLNLTKVDLSNATTTSAIIPLSGNTANYYGMVEQSDTVYIAFCGTNGSSSTYLMKVPADLSAVLPYNTSSSTGEFPSSINTSSHEVLIGYNTVTNSISVTAENATQNNRYKYQISDGTVTTYTSTFVADVAGPPITHSEANGLIHFGNFSDGVAGNPTTMVLREDLSTFAVDTVGHYFFGGIGAQATNHRLNYSEHNQRFCASYYDAMNSEREYYVSNELPTLEANPSIGSLCQNQYTSIFTSIGIRDVNYDNLSIISITSSNTAAIDPSTIFYGLINTVGQISYFEIYGSVGNSGSADLTIQVTDGWDTVSFVLPTVTITSVPSPLFSVPTLDICSGNGLVDMNQFVTPSGGSFYITSLEIDFTDGLYDSDNSPLSAENMQTVTYAIYINGCSATSTADIVYHLSPSITLSTAPTSCGLATGSAISTVIGAATPLQYEMWSSGEINTSSVSNLAEGIYTYSLKDANNCVVTETFAIVPSGVDATATIQDVLCFGQHNGSISITPSGLTAPVEYLWSSGHSTASVSNLYAGEYTVQISDANNCLLTKTFTVAQPEKLVGEYNWIAPTCGLSDGVMEVLTVTGGTLPYDYAWSNGATSAIVNNVAFGVYSVTITDGQGCQTIQPFYMSEANSADLSGNMQGSDCGSDNGSIDVSPYVFSGDPIASITWSNGATTEDIFNLAPANYICTLVVANTNCKAVRGWNIPIVAPQQQPICVVTVDSTTTTNLVVWEPVQPTGIAYYNIYRETSNQGEYILIDTVQASNLSLFNDVVASPVARSWSYKIAAVNGCDIESPISFQHRTMHLSVVDNGTGVDVSWNAYEGTDYDTFVLSRYTSANGWEVVANLAASQLTYTDNTPFSTAGLDYMVELQLLNQCTALLYKAQDFNTTRSNKDKGSFVSGEGTGDSNNEISESYLQTISIYPNPTNDVVYMVQPDMHNIAIRLLTLTGQVIIESNSEKQETTITTEHLASGIYLLELSMNGIRQTQRIIKN